MKRLGFILTLLMVGCAGSESAPAVQAKKAFTSFSHLKKKDTNPFESTFLNPVFTSEKRTPPKKTIAAEGPLKSTALLWFNVYQNTLSRLDGSTCNFSPTCSGFAIQAISKSGPLGFGLALGRLHKNHLDHSFYSNKDRRLFDPLDNYTFWLEPTKPDNFDAYQDPAHAWFQHVSLVNE